MQRRNQITGQAKAMNRVETAPLWSWLVVAALTASSAINAAFAAPYLDTIRDIYWAARIAEGAEWPLVGPQIGFFTWLGPIWFYLLAPAIWLTGSFVGVAVWAGLLAGLQCPLALMIGQRLGDWRFGLILACLLGLPSLASFTQLSMTHVDLVVAAVLAFALVCLVHWQKGTVAWSVATGLAFMMMIHAHPTTLVFGLALPWVWLVRRERRLARALGMALGVTLPLLPLLVAALAGDSSPWADIDGYVSATFSLAELRHVPLLAWQLIVTLPVEAFGLMGAAGSTGRTLLILLAATIGLLALIGALAMRQRPLSLQVLGGLALALLFYLALVALMRHEIWWYMLLGAVPLQVAIVALLLRGLPQPTCDVLVLPAVLAAALLCSVLMHLELRATAHDVDQRHFPIHLLADLKRPSPAVEDLPMPHPVFVDVDRLAGWLCGQPEPVRIHGALAQTVDGLGGTGGMMACPPGPEMAIGGRAEPAGSRWLGLGHPIAARLEREPAESVSVFALYPVEEVLHPEQPVSAASARNYLPRPWQAPPREATDLVFELAADQVLIISKPFVWWTSTVIERVRANGRTIEPLAEDRISAVYRCSDCADPVVWQVRFRAPPEMPPDIVSIGGQ